LVEIANLNPKHSFRYINLAGISFAGQDLKGFDFTGANLTGCEFVGARIEGAVFDDAILDKNGEAVVMLARELALPYNDKDILVPDIIMALVQEAHDFTEAARNLRLLKREDHVPVRCFARVLELAPNETAAFHLVNSWEEFFSFPISDVAENLCKLIKSAPGAAVAVENMNRWRIHPHDLVTHLGSPEAKMEAITMLAKNGAITEQTVSALSNTKLHRRLFIIFCQRYGHGRRLKSFKFGKKLHRCSANK
jgi:hypothetical protein